MTLFYLFIYMKRIQLLVLFPLVCFCAGAQDIILTHSDEVIRAYNLEIGQSAVFFTLEEKEGAKVHKISKSDIFIIKRADGTRFDPNEALDNVSQASAPVPDNAKRTPLNFSDFHGYLMGRGCNVYVTSHFGASYEQPAVDVIKQYLRTRNYWNVVESAEEAHFVIQFGVDISHDDYAVVVLRTRDAYFAKPILTFGLWVILDDEEPGTLLLYHDDNGTEDGSINAQCATSMLNKNYFISFEIDDDDPILEFLRSGEQPDKSCFPMHLLKERARGTVPTSWARYGSRKNFWEHWKQFYKQ